MVTRIGLRRAWHFGILVLALSLAGCGGGGGGGPTGPSGTVRIDGRVASASTAEAPRDSLVAWVLRLLNWSRAEAQVANCTVSAPGAAAVTTDNNGRFVLVNVPTANGSVTITISCPGVSGTLTLNNLPPGAEVNIEVDVRPGQVGVRAQNVDLNPSPPSPSPSVSVSPAASPSPSPPSPPSPPSLKPRT